MFEVRSGNQASEASARNVLARPVSPADETQAVSALGRELSLADNQAGYVLELIEKLERRLQPISFVGPPNGPAAAGGTGDTSVAPTDVSRMVQGINARTAEAIDRLRTVLERIDL